MNHQLKLGVVTAVAAIMLSTGLAHAASAPKTTGGIVFGQNGTRTSLGFEAVDNGPVGDRGTATWVRTGDIWANRISGKVIDTVVSGNDAYFTVMIDKSSNYPAWVGLELRFYVHDGGTSGTEGDTVSWQWMTGPYVGGAASEPIMGGNLQVRN